MEKIKLEIAGIPAVLYGKLVFRCVRCQQPNSVR